MWSKPSDAPLIDQEPAPVVSDTTPTPSVPGVKDFAVTGANFTFSPAEMRVKVGDTVRIKFTNAEGFHDLVIDDNKERNS